MELAAWQHGLTSKFDSLDETSWRCQKVDGLGPGFEEFVARQNILTVY